MRYGKSTSLLLISLALGLTALVLAVGLPVWAQEPTETPVIWPTETPTATFTPGAFATRTLIPIPTSTSFTPPPTRTPTVGPPGGPGWDNVEWVHPPTSQFRPGCPSWSASGVDTSRLDWRWLAQCLECVPGAFYDPLSTPLPSFHRTPTALPDGLYLSTDYEGVSVEPFFSQLLEREFNDQVWSFPALEFDAVGVYFNVAVDFQDGTCRLTLRGDRVGSPVAEDVTLQVGQYCVGPAQACAQYAPGARRPSDRFRVVNAGVPLLLSTRAGGEGCYSGNWTLSDVQFLGIQYYVTPTPTATGTPASPYALTCPMRLLTVSENTNEYLDTFSWGDGARYPWGYPDHALVYGVVFRPAIPSADHLVWADPVARVGGVSVLSGALGAAALIDGDLYCAGDYHVCQAVAEGEHFHWFDLPEPISLSEDVLEFGLRVLPVDQQVEVTVDVQFIVAAPGPDCSLPEPTPTPYVTPAATYVPASVKWAGVSNLGCPSSVTCARVSDYVARVTWSAPAGGWVSVDARPQFDGYAQSMDLVIAPAQGAVPVWEWLGSCPGGPSTYWSGHIVGMNGFQRGAYASEIVTINGVAGLRRRFKDMYGAEVLDLLGIGRSCPANNAPARLYDFYVIIERVNGNETAWSEAFGAPPTPTPTATPPSVVRTPTPGPGEITSEQCEWVALRKPSEPPIAWPDIEHLTPDEPACWTAIPRFRINLPDALGFEDFEFPAMGVCFDLYQITPIKLLDISIDAGVLLLPLFVAVMMRIFFL